MSRNTDPRVDDLLAEVAALKSRIKAAEVHVAPSAPSIDEHRALAKRLERIESDANLAHVAMNEIQAALREVRAKGSNISRETITALAEGLSEKILEERDRTDHAIKSVRSHMGQIVSDAERAALAGAKAAEKSVTDFAAQFAYGDDR